MQTSGHSSRGLQLPVCLQQQPVDQPDHTTLQKQKIYAVIRVALLDLQEFGFETLRMEHHRLDQRRQTDHQEMVKCDSGGGETDPVTVGGEPEVP